MLCGRNFAADTKQVVAIAMINPSTNLVIISFTLKCYAFLHQIRKYSNFLLAVSFRVDSNFRFDFIITFQKESIRNFLRSVGCKLVLIDTHNILHFCTTATRLFIMILFRLIIYCVINITITFSSDIWPGDSSVTTVDDSNEFGSNLSGLYYYSSDTETKNSNNSNISSDFLFAISNDPSIIYKLYWDGFYWKKYQGSVS